MRVAVVGAGVIGAALAYRLADGGAEVMLIDRDHPGTGTSAKTFAWLNSNRKLPREYYELNLAGLREHLSLPAEFGAAGWLHTGGNLEWARDADGHRELKQRVQRLRSWGYAARWLTLDEVATEFEPELRPNDAFPPIACFPDEAWIDAVGFTQHFVERAENSGACLRFGATATEIHRSGERITAVRVGDAEPVAVDTVVNAAGANAETVAGLVRRRLPLASTSGLLVRIRAENVHRVVHAPEVNLRPDGPGHILVHHDSIDERMWAGEPVAALAEKLARRTHAVLPTAGETTETRVGVRPMPVDGLPSLGQVSSRPGYYEAVTHSGVTLAPILARCLTEEILTGQVNPLAASFPADRFDTP